MNKTLQDLAWSVLPNGNKVYCRNMYHTSHDGNVIDLLERLYGLHNLTSDAKGEVELLHATRQKVMGLYANAKKIHDLYTSATCINTKESQQIDICKGVMSILDTLFGSKCLPDELNEDNFTKSEIEAPYFIKDGVAYRMLKGNNGFVQKEIGKVDDEEPQPAEPKESPRQFYRVMGTDEHGRQVVTPIPSQLAGSYDISKERTEPDACNVASSEPYVDSSEPKPAEPKFKVGDKVMLNGYGGFVISAFYLDLYTQEYKYRLGGFKGHLCESDLEPYTEPKVKRHVSVKEACEILGVDESEATTLAKSEPIETCTDDCSSQCSSQDFDNSFSKERRLNIATQVLCAIIPKYQDDGDGIGLSVLNEKDMIKCAYRLADALIAECEKKGGLQ